MFQRANNGIRESVEWNRHQPNGKRFSSISNERGSSRRIQRVQRLDFVDLIYELEPLAYRFGMKPHEFWNSTYREAKLYVESQSSQLELEIKNNIMLAENLGNKLISASMVSRKPKNINLIKDVYNDFFKEELKKENALHPKPREGEELLQFMYELGEELKQETNNKE